MTVTIVRTIADLRHLVKEWRTQGLRVAMTPTMGALHQGHLSLVKAGFERADRVIATIFVNPTQFGPGEDFANYPRGEAADLALLDSVGCSALYAPDVGQTYGPGFATTVTVAGVSQGLCGDVRPTHFQGVATVVTKLLLQGQPDVALFGEKDYQQLAVIRRLTADLDIPVEIAGVPTLREADGLAMSSRNRYLTAEQRSIAPLLYQQLQIIQHGLAFGQTSDGLIDAAHRALLAAGFASVDYIAVCDAETLQPVPNMAGRNIRVLAAARLGSARLIDNIAVLSPGV